MLFRDGEADRYPRRGPDDPGAPFFDGTMEHVVSSTPTDATRRNPGILGPYYPDATHGSNVGAPGRADRAPTKGVQPMSIAAVLAAVPDTERRRAAVLAA
jgi:hypothetical protein